MDDDIKVSTMVYTADQVATMLDIKTSTLRKYAGLLSKQGYKFHTNEKGHRGYFNQDVAVLKKLTEIKESTDMTLERAANAVMTWVDTSDISGSDTQLPVDNERYNKRFDELEKKIEEQNEIIKQLIKTIDETDRKRESAMKQRDHIMNQYVNEIQETKKLIAATQEEKKGFLQRLFNK